MPKNRNTYAVTEDPHEKFVFWVESWSDPENPYKVNLLLNSGNGACTCKDFQTRCHKNWKENGNKVINYGIPQKPNPNRTICRHIVCARWRFLNDLLKMLHDQHGENA